MSALLSCTRCPKLVASRQRVVPARGPLDARVLVVGEAPGQREDESGTNFIGRSGQILDSLLREAGIDPRSVRRDNTIKCRPPNDRDPAKSELTNCRPWLAAELERLKPGLDVIVAVGAAALHWFLPNEKLSQAHGHPYETEWGVVFPTYHPAAMLYDHGLKPVVALDFRNLKRFLKGEQPTTQDFRLTSWHDLIEVAPTVIAFDYETTTPAIHGRFATTLARPIGVAYAWMGDGWKRPDALYERPNMLGPLTWPGVTLVAHNAKFEISVSASQGIKLEHVEDTKLMAHLLGFRDTGLKSLCGSVLDVRHMRFDEWDGEDPLYPAGDAAYTLSIWHRFNHEIDEAGLRSVYNNIELPIIPILSRMERAGVRVDVALLHQLSAELTAELGGMVDAMPAGINPNSYPQVAKYMYEVLELPINWKLKTDTGLPSVCAEALRELHHPDAEAIIRWKELFKLRGTYTDKLPKLVHEDGRVHGSFNQAGNYNEDGEKDTGRAATFRLTSSDPNLQNVPRRDPVWGPKIRSAFIPQDGWRYVKADVGQEEPRIAAWLGPDPVLMSRLDAGADIYLPVAQHLFDIMFESPWEISTKARPKEFAAWKKIERDDGVWRDIGKQLFLSDLYGSGWQKKQAVCAKWGYVISNKQARQLQRRMDGEYVAAAKLQEKARAELEECFRTGAPPAVTTPFGHRRRLYKAGANVSKRDMTDAIREGANMYVQGTAAAVMKLWLIAIDGGLKEGGLRSFLVLTVHDEAVLECPPEETAAVMELCRRSIKGILPIELPVDVDERSHW